MGLPMENSYKTDPPKQYMNFQKKILDLNFLSKVSPKNPKTSPKNGQNMKGNFYS